MQTHDEGGCTLDQARRQVQAFFASAAALSPDELRALRREQRRTRVSLRLSTDPDFLRAVCDGTWTEEHAQAAREIRAQARAQAAAMVPWPRRVVVANALEEAALAILSEADPQHPLAESLCARLIAPWQRATGRVLPTPRPSSE